MNKTKMKRCHHQNGELIELIEAAHVRDVVQNKLSQVGTNEIGNICGYEYHCRDCGKYFKYQNYNSIKLAWLRKIHEQLFNEFDPMSTGRVYE